MLKVLNKINEPKDLKGLSKEELEQVLGRFKAIIF